MNDIKIIIAGAGPAGISTWLNIHKKSPGLAKETIVLEKESFPRDKLCGGAVGWFGLETIESLKIKLEIPSVQINNIIYRLFGKDYRQSRNNAMKIFMRKEFDNALVQHAIDLGCTLIEDEELLDIQIDNEKVFVKTIRNNYNVKTVIGADGSLSRVRKIIFPDKKPQLCRTIEVFVPLNPDKDHEFDNNSVVFDFTAIEEGLQGYVWHFPCPGYDVPMMNHGIFDSQILKDKKPAELKKILYNSLKERGFNPEDTQLLSFPIHWLSDKTTLSKPRVLLAGDAAGIEPAFGGGIHLSLAYGEIAAEEVIEAFENDNFSYKNYSERVLEHPIGKNIIEKILFAKKIYSGNHEALENILSNIQ